jgi:hypothetical protein
MDVFVQNVTKLISVRARVSKSIARGRTIPAEVER